MNTLGVELARFFNGLKILLFIFVLLSMLLIAGTVTLKFFIPLFTALLNAQGWPETVGTIAAIFIMIAMSFVMLVFAIYIYRFLIRKRALPKRVILFIIITSGVYLSVWLLRHPEYQVNVYGHVRQLVVNESLKISKEMGLHTIKIIRLQQGTAVQIDNVSIFSPGPTQQELNQSIIHSPNPLINISIKNIVSVEQDLSKPKLRIGQHDRREMELRGIDTYYFPIALTRSSSEAIFKIAQAIKSLPGATLVYDTQSPVASRALQILILSYLLNRPVLTKALFAAHPTINVLIANVATGPIPKTDNDYYYLQKKGIRSLGYLGRCSELKSLLILNSARANEMKSICLDTNSFIDAKVFFTSGPWYLCGTISQNLKNELLKQDQKQMSPLVKKYLHAMETL